MTKQEIIDKAKYIQFPLTENTYRNFEKNKTISKLPLINGSMYSAWPLNEHHLTTEYHRKYVLPALAELLGFRFNLFDFELVEKFSGKFDISYLKPKRNYRFDIYGYNHDEFFSEISFSDVMSCSIDNGGLTDFHRLYKYPHECSRLVNLDLVNYRKLMISGDSQMIPIIALLGCIFKEVWYFDNRTSYSFADKYRDVEFTDVLFELNCNPITKYYNNLK